MHIQLFAINETKRSTVEPSNNKTTRVAKKLLSKDVANVEKEIGCRRRKYGLQREL